MYQINTTELETLVTRYVKQYGRRSSTVVIKQIIDALEYNYRKSQNPDFNGKILTIQVDFEKVSDTLCQYTIYTRFRDDYKFKRLTHLTELEKNIMGLNLHSHVVYSMLHPLTRKMINMLSNTTKITYSSDKIIINNCHILVPAIIVYNLINCKDMVSIYYCHMENEHLFDTDFKKYHHRYLEAHNNFKDKIEEQKKQRRDELLRIHKNEEALKLKQEQEEKLNNNVVFDQSKIKLTDKDINNMSRMTEQQKTDYLYRKFLINKKLKKHSNLVSVKTQITDEQELKEKYKNLVSKNKTKSSSKPKTSNSNSGVNYGNINSHFDDMEINLDFNSNSWFDKIRSRKKKDTNKKKKAYSDTSPRKPVNKSINTKLTYNDDDDDSPFVNSDGNINFSAMSEYSQINI